eukprot:CAMPEP_0202440078 /NCGR_PEP_ID=MMETSP1345-20130828/36502_1 /ASSEMBLY_ACC=CAM_ASM_000843 /TAXON_ID=342563 /ORGANISM="Fabrea Fabrea salina" /LENGTH=486 /DNA_ID=CAMNT_0049054651 /DNA_START=413 /DNA_END=1872 /DNA_ORIENTATION=+
MAFEVADVCCRVLDWEESCFTYAAGYYFMLLDKLCEMSKDTSFAERKVQLMEELVIRIEAGKSEDCSIPNQYARNLALLTLAKYWQPDSSEALQKLVRMVRLRLFNTEMMGFLGPEMSVSSSLSVTFLLSSCAYIGVRFHEELSQSVQKILEEFIEVLESNKGPEAIIELSYKIIGIVNRAKQEGQEHIDQFDLVLDQKKGISIVEDSFFQDSLHAALNIFSEPGTKYETIVPEKPMQLLKIKQTASEMNWRCLEMQEITGLADPIRVWCNNVIYPSYSLVVFCFKAYNSTKFELQNIKFQYLISQNLKFGLKQPRSSSVSSLSTEDSFEFKVRAIIKDSGQVSISLKVSVEGDSFPEESAQYNTLIYSVPFPRLLLKDTSSSHSVSHFLSLWTRLVYGDLAQCSMGSIESVRHKVGKYMQEALYVEEFGSFKLGWQAANLQGDRVVLYISGSRNSRNVRTEVKDFKSLKLFDDKQVFGNLFARVK